MNQNLNIPKNQDFLIGRKFQNYTLTEKIGEGSFGMIYKAESKSDLVAFKFEKPRPNHISLLDLEYKIMKELAGKGIPKVFKYIPGSDYSIMILELLGKSLENLMKSTENKKFSTKTVAMLGKEMITLIEIIHNKNYIHRDIKPDNFATGYTSQKELYILDFGLAKKYRSSKTLKHNSFVKNKKLTGTARYASINALSGYEQSRRDDLEAIGYVLLYFLRGNLPWQGMLVRNKEERYSKILEKKRLTTAEELCKGFPKEFCTYIDYTRNLGFEEEPKYEHLRNLFDVIIKGLGEECDYRYDWIEQNAVYFEPKIIENYLVDDNFSDKNNPSNVSNNGENKLINNLSNMVNFNNDEKDDDIKNYKNGLIEGTNAKINNNINIEDKLAKKRICCIIF